MGNVISAFLLTLFAGLSTGIGSAISLLAKKANAKFLAVSLGFSAGVMIYVSMAELFLQAKATLGAHLGEKTGSWAAVGAFFGGILLIAVIDRLIPEQKNPHNMQAAAVGLSSGAAADAESDKTRRLMRMGLLTALALAIHNFPEGLATFVAGLSSPKVAIPVAVAIAIHNIPEGIAVSVPIYYATGDRGKAFLYSFVSGLSEPLGAVIGYVFLRNFLNEVTMGVVFAVVSGIMVFISLDELLPSAREYGEQHLSIYGMVAGMAVMAISLLLFI